MVSGPMTCSQRHHSGVFAPRLDSRCALFLDIDGTLLDIAVSPDAVVVPDSLAPLLERASAWLGGALAVVSGRSLRQIDVLMAPLVLTGAGEHGAVLRTPDGKIERAAREISVPEVWLSALLDAVNDWPGVLIEPKSYSVAVHYRMAPEREAALRALIRDIVAENPSEFEVLPAAKAFEIRSRKFSKATPVLRLMDVAPFAGRIPIFVGDDVTDHDGFRAAESLGGYGLNVHEIFDGKPAEVLRWLEASLQNT